MQVHNPISFDSFSLSIRKILNALPHLPKLQMDYLKRFSVLFQKRRNRFSQHPGALENSHLANIPTEILLEMIDYLSIPSAALFTLSCRYLYLLIGTRHIEKLANSKEDTGVFLQLLGRDLQDQIFCARCKKLHKIKDTGKYTENNQLDLLELGPSLFPNKRKGKLMWCSSDHSSIPVFKLSIKKYTRSMDYNDQSLPSKLLSGKYYSNAWHTLVKTQQAKNQIKNNFRLTSIEMLAYGACHSAEPGNRFFWVGGYLELRTVTRLCNVRIATSNPECSQEKRWPIFIPPYSGSSDNDQEPWWYLHIELDRCPCCGTEYQASSSYGDNCCTINFAITAWKDCMKGHGAETWHAHFPFESRTLLNDLQTALNVMSASGLDGETTQVGIVFS